MNATSLGTSGPSRAVRAFGRLFARGDLRGVALLFVLCCNAGLNAVLMWFEDLVIPGLATLPLDRVVFILGHHRSGTTNLHKTLRHHPELRVGTMFDVLFPSLLLKRLFRSRVARWLVPAFNRSAANRYDSANHAVGLDEELEEHLWLLHRLRSEAFLLMFPSLLRGAPDVMSDFVEVTDRELTFVTRCLRRMVFDERDQCLTYVARPLLFTMHVRALLRHVPEARVVFCVREPAAAIRSHGAMTQAQLRGTANDPRVVAWAEGFYRFASIRQYEAMLDVLSDPAMRDRVHAIDFDDIRRDLPTVARRLVTTLGFSTAIFPEERSESHGAADAPRLIDPKRIESDLGDVYRRLRTHSSREAHA